MGLIKFSFCQGQFKYSDRVQGAQNAILNLQFEKYDSIVQTLTKAENGMQYWLGSYKSFIEFKTSSVKQKPDSILSIIKSNSIKMELLEINNPYYYWCLADNYLMQTIICFEKNEIFKSIQSYIQAKNLISKYHIKFPGFNYGLKHELIVESFNVLVYSNLSLFSSKTDGSGISTIINKQSLLNLPILKREFKLLSLILIELQSGTISKGIEERYTIDIADACMGPLEAIIYANQFKHQENHRKQMQVLCKSYHLGYFSRLNTLNLWYGTALLNQRNDSAIMFLDAFLVKQQNQLFSNYARYKASVFHYLKGNAELSDSLINIIQQETVWHTGEDNQAQYEAKYYKFWSPELVEARVLFDGGNYKLAANVLLAAKSKIPNYSPEQRLEYSYRLGRIYDTRNDLKQAKKFYELVIYSKLESEFYYPSYAAYYLGEMYETAGDVEKSKYYFALCTELNSPIYKASIHKKAKQKLNK